MTRADFDRRFAATELTTEGYSSAQLASVNEAVFTAVRYLSGDDDRTKSAVDHAFAAAFADLDRRTRPVAAN